MLRKASFFHVGEAQTLLAARTSTMYDHIASYFIIYGLAFLSGESLRQILIEQIDLEIALKKRLAAGAHARLEWAKLLRSSLDDTEAGMSALLG